MTSLIAWLGVDGGAVSSLYISTDSRISENKAIITDKGRKTFFSAIVPVIFGFSGRCQFPNVAIPDLIRTVDTNKTIFENLNIEEKIEYVRVEFQAILNRITFNDTEPLEIIMGTRSGSKRPSKYGFATFKVVGKNIEKNILEVRKASGVVKYGGSGKEIVQDWQISSAKSLGYGTTRVIFQAFCESIESNDDLETGGVPQTVGIYPTGAAFPIGYVFNETRYLNGAETFDFELISKTKWRNKYFEVADGFTKKKKRGAQTHAKERIIKQIFEYKKRTE